jgi:hypothetical protein
MIGVTRRRGRRSKQLLDYLKEKRKILEIESGSARSHSVANWLWKRLWNCCNTEYEKSADLEYCFIGNLNRK